MRRALRKRAGLGFFPADACKANVDTILFIESHHASGMQLNYPTSPGALETWDNDCVVDLDEAELGAPSSFHRAAFAKGEGADFLVYVYAHAGSEPWLVDSKTT